MSGIVGSKFNIRGSGLVGSLGTDGQHMLSSGAGKKHVFETVAAAAYDDEPIKSDLTALALREATNESSAAFNLPGSFIETFTDDTNLGTQTTGDRASGYWSTVVMGSLTNLIEDNWDWGSAGAKTAGAGVIAHAASPDEDVMMVTNASATTPLTFAANQPFEFTLTNENDAYGIGGILIFYKTSEEPAGSPTNTGNAWRKHSTEGLNSLEDSFMLYMGDGAGGSGGLVQYGTGGGVTSVTSPGQSGFEFQDTQVTITRDVDGVFRIYQGTSSGTLILTSNTYGGEDLTSTAEYAIAYGSSGGRGSNGTGVQYAKEQNIATGTLIQSANSVTGTRTEVGGTMLYADGEGTATLGTDLSIFFSCDGGSNWTETDTYTAITPVYASGIKQVRLGKVTCTGGTDVRYKAVFANQSAGSKETQLHGIGINY